MNSIAQAVEEDLSKSELKSLARAAERINDIETAALYYEDYLELKPEDLKITSQLADHYREMGQYAKAEKLYEQLVTADEDKFLLEKFYWAEMLKAQGRCDAAIPHFESFRKAYLGKKDDRKYRRLAKFNVEGCENAIREIEEGDRGKYAIKVMGGEINGSHMEASPIFFDEKTLLFVSVKGELKEEYKPDELMPERKFYQSKRIDEKWENVQEWPIIPEIKNKEVASGAFNSDQSRFYFSACEYNYRGKLDCDLFRLDRMGSSWSPPKKLGEVINTKYTETQVAVGIDEEERETIYFVSDRAGGKGGLDIWYSTYYESKDKYRTPRNCGSKINSVGDEMTPFVSMEKGRFYFSSDGHPGNGGLDVFQSVGSRSRWEEPERLSRDINSPADELYFVLSSNTEEGIFASNRDAKQGEKYCCDDLFEFKALDNIRLMAKGKVRSDDLKSAKSLKGAKIKVYRKDKSSDERYFQQMVLTDDSGEFKLRLEPNKQYVIRAEKDGYLSKEEELSTENQLSSVDYNVNFQLNEITEEAFRLENIYYEFGKAELSEGAHLAMDTTILKVLKENPGIVVEIGSHTDSVGNEGYNQNLSQRRAESVVNYLLQKGIAKSRLKAKGYGESQPVAPNSNPDGTDNEEGRAENRRTEFKVIGKINLIEDED